MFADEEGKASRLHWRRPLGHVDQKESHVHRPGHGEQHLSLKGKSRTIMVNSLWVTDILECLGAYVLRLFSKTLNILLLIWLYGTQVKSPELFEEWVSKMRHHRVFRQNEIAMYPHERHLFNPHASSSPSLSDSLRKVSANSRKHCCSLGFHTVRMLLCDAGNASCSLVCLFETEGYSD